MKNVGVGRILGEERRREFRPDLVGACAMHGPIAAAMRCGAAPSFVIAATVASSTPPTRAAPAGMRRADRCRPRIGEQHRRAIGGEDAERDARRFASPCASARGRPSRGHGCSRPSRQRAVHLVAGGEAVGRRGRAPPRRGGGSRRRSSGSSPEPKPQLSEAKMPVADAALAGEEAVAEPGGVERVSG